MNPHPTTTQLPQGAFIHQTQTHQRQATLKSSSLQKRQCLANAPTGQDVQFRKLILPSSDSYDGSAELSSQQLPRAAKNESSRSRSSDASFWVTSTGWNVPKLLDLSDTVRATLNDDKDLTPTEMGNMIFVLGMMIAAEMDDAWQSKSQEASQRVGISIIQCARLDKLLADMISANEQGADAESKGKLPMTGLWPEFDMAQNLQNHWSERFKNEYFALDRRRCDDLIAGGLRDMLFSDVSGGRGESSSQEEVVLSEQEGMAHFVPGQQVGRKTKVIRGFRLKSVYAPQAGIRYDGLYNINSWGIKLCPCTDLYTMKVILQRLPRQKPMREVLQIPKPSQLDDWAWYEKLEKEAINQREGAVRLSDWQAAREKEITERDYWREVRERNRELDRNGEAGRGSESPSPRQTQWPRRSKKPGIGTGLGTPEWPRKEEVGK
ncbi:hypothetical protein VSDG_03831 [Cytospora chrysosperma]|uniref:YDG domain-containing protein n=1 Tax=Cytospora chrysosperma TaxID=252740 RepID=A0A423W6N0_CYTCH|nr:hypothetical protein VSDG_03831 [Valsa sordida]